ncbi:hypothetical protein E2562_016489 [Oryza meyeriana var. granulata]|uniref:Uncharacterized protein n=1 Tax=Oryza meyeriana var. granulata TaxID=110450 RepID=A0A6G1BMS4_9ORYZ|nr:hypothetical protein E2562_016489 [Oryza meyeriana var. granulata]
MAGAPGSDAPKLGVARSDRETMVVRHQCGSQWRRWLASSSSYHAKRVRSSRFSDGTASP